jgi:hypothetical protein
MGAQQFDTVAYGKTPREAFSNAVDQARYDHGHSGYSGTMAEKDSYTLLDPGTEDPATFAERLMAEDDPRICDKWGPAGCVKLDGNDEYLFFGWASS